MEMAMYLITYLTYMVSTIEAAIVPLGPGFGYVSNFITLTHI